MLKFCQEKGEKLEKRQMNVVLLCDLNKIGEHLKNLKEKKKINSHRRFTCDTYSIARVIPMFIRKGGHFFFF